MDGGLDGLLEVLGSHAEQKLSVDNIHRRDVLRVLEGFTLNADLFSGLDDADPFRVVAMEEAAAGCSVKRYIEKYVFPFIKHFVLGKQLCLEYLYECVENGLYEFNEGECLYEFSVDLRKLNVPGRTVATDQKPQYVASEEYRAVFMRIAEDKKSNRYRLFFLGGAAVDFRVPSDFAPKFLDGGFFALFGKSQVLIFRAEEVKEGEYIPYLSYEVHGPPIIDVSIDPESESVALLFPGFVYDHSNKKRAVVQGAISNDARYAILNYTGSSVRLCSLTENSELVERELVMEPFGSNSDMYVPETPQRWARMYKVNSTTFAAAGESYDITSHTKITKMTLFDYELDQKSEKLSIFYGGNLLGIFRFDTTLSGIKPQATPISANYITVHFGADNHVVIRMEDVVVDTNVRFGEKGALDKYDTLAFLALCRNSYPACQDLKKEKQVHVKLMTLAFEHKELERLRRLLLDPRKNVNSILLLTKESRWRDLKEFFSEQYGGKDDVVSILKEVILGYDEHRISFFPVYKEYFESVRLDVSDILDLLRETADPVTEFPIPQNPPKLTAALDDLERLGGTEHKLLAGIIRKFPIPSGFEWSLENLGRFLVEKVRQVKDIKLLLEILGTDYTPLFPTLPPEDGCLLHASDIIEENLVDVSENLLKLSRFWVGNSVFVFFEIETPEKVRASPIRKLPLSVVEGLFEKIADKKYSGTTKYLMHAISFSRAISESIGFSITTLGEMIERFLVRKEHHLFSKEFRITDWSGYISSILYGEVSLGLDPGDRRLVGNRAISMYLSDHPLDGLVALMKKFPEYFDVEESGISKRIYEAAIQPLLPPSTGRLEPDVERVLTDYIGMFGDFDHLETKYSIFQHIRKNFGMDLVGVLSIDFSNVEERLGVIEQVISMSDTLDGVLVSKLFRVLALPREKATRVNSLMMKKAIDVSDYSRAVEIFRSTDQVDTSLGFLILGNDDVLPRHRREVLGRLISRAFDSRNFEVLRSCMRFADRKFNFDGVGAADFLEVDFKKRRMVEKKSVLDILSDMYAAGDGDKVNTFFRNAEIRNRIAVSEKVQRNFQIFSEFVQKNGIDFCDPPKDLFRRVSECSGDPVVVSFARAFVPSFSPWTVRLWNIVDLFPQSTMTNKEFQTRVFEVTSPLDKDGILDCISVLEHVPEIYNGEDAKKVIGYFDVMRRLEESVGNQEKALIYGDEAKFVFQFNRNIRLKHLNNFGFFRDPKRLFEEIINKKVFAFMKKSLAFYNRILERLGIPSLTVSFLNMVYIKYLLHSGLITMNKTLETLLAGLDDAEKERLVNDLDGQIFIPQDFRDEILKFLG